MALDFSHIHQRINTPTKQTWSGVEVVDYLKTQFEIPDDGAFGYTSWLRRVKKVEMSLEQAKRVVEIMKSREKWLMKEKGEKLHRGKWMFNRFRYDFKEMTIDKFISKNS